MKFPGPKDLSSAAAALCSERPWLLIGAVALVTGALAVGLPRYSMEANNDDFFADEDLASRGRLRTDFRGVRRDVFVFAEAVGGNLLEPACLRELAEVEAALRADPALAPLLGKAGVVGPHTLVQAVLTKVNARLAALSGPPTLEGLRALITGPDDDDTAPASTPKPGITPVATLHHAAELARALIDPLVGHDLPPPPGYGEHLAKGQLSLSDLSLAQAEVMLRAAVAFFPDAREILSSDLELRAPTLHAKAALLVVRLETDAMADASDPRPEWDVLRVLEAQPQRAVSLVALSDRIMDRYIDRDMEENFGLFGLTALITAAILALAFRRFADTAVALLLFVVANVWMLGIAGFLGYRFNLLVFMGPILVLSLGDDYAHHLAARYDEERSRRGRSPKDALRGAIQNGGGALLLSALTTAVGFAANATSGIRAVSEFGVTLAVGIVATLILLGLVGPTVRYVLDRRRSSSAGEGHAPTGAAPPHSALERAASSLVGGAAARPGVVLVVAGALAIAGIGAGLGLETEFRPTESLREGSPVTAAIERMEEVLPVAVVRDVEVLVEGPVAEAGAVSALEQVTDRLRDDRFVRLDRSGRPRASTYLDGVGGAAEAARVVASGASLSARLRSAFDQSIASPEAGDRVSASLRAGASGTLDAAVLRVPVTGALAGTRAQEEIARGIHEDLAPLRDAGLAVTVGGEPVLLGKVNQNIVGSLATGTLVTLGVCLLVLSLAFASLRYGLIALVPVVLVNCWLAGTLKAFGMPLNMATVLIVSMGIGAGVDYAIHVLHRYIEERGRGLSPVAAAAEAAARLAEPMLGSMLTTALGIGVLVLATQDFFTRFAVLTFATILFTFLATVLVLPPLLVRFDRSGAAEAIFQRICHCARCGSAQPSHAEGACTCCCDRAVHPPA